MVTQIRARWLPMATVIAAVVLGVSNVPVGAQVLKCSSESLSRTDQARLNAAMQSAMPSGVPIKGYPSICRNEGSAHSWLETRHEANPNGFDEWWELRCTRGRRDWSCESPVQKRELKMELLIDGVTRHITVGFDSGTSAVQVRDLIGRTFALLETGSVAPKACDYGVPVKVDDDAWSKAKNGYRPKPTDTELAATVESDEDGTSVLLSEAGGLALTFAPDTQHPEQLVLKCWGEWVVVT